MNTAMMMSQNLRDDATSQSTVAPKVTTFADLPEHLLFNVCQHLDLYTVLRVQCVSSRLFRSLDIRRFSFSPSDHPQGELGAESVCSREVSNVEDDVDEPHSSEAYTSANVGVNIINTTNASDGLHDEQQQAKSCTLPSDRGEENRSRLSRIFTSLTLDKRWRKAPPSQRYKITKYLSALKTLTVDNSYYQDDGEDYVEPPKEGELLPIFASTKTGIVEDEPPRNAHEGHGDDNAEAVGLAPLTPQNLQRLAVAEIEEVENQESVFSIMSVFDDDTEEAKEDADGRERILSAASTRPSSSSSSRASHCEGRLDGAPINAMSDNALPSSSSSSSSEDEDDSRQPAERNVRRREIHREGTVWLGRRAAELTHQEADEDLVNGTHQQWVVLPDETRDDPLLRMEPLVEEERQPLPREAAAERPAWTTPRTCQRKLRGFRLFCEALEVANAASGAVEVLDLGGPPENASYVLDRDDVLPELPRQYVMQRRRMAEAAPHVGDRNAVDIQGLAVGENFPPQEALRRPDAAEDAIDAHIAEAAARLDERFGDLQEDADDDDFREDDEDDDDLRENDQGQSRQLEPIGNQQLVQEEEEDDNQNDDDIDRRQEIAGPRGVPAIRFPKLTSLRCSATVDCRHVVPLIDFCEFPELRSITVGIVSAAYGRLAPTFGFGKRPTVVLAPQLMVAAERAAAGLPPIEIPHPIAPRRSPRRAEGGGQRLVEDLEGRVEEHLPAEMANGEAGGERAHLPPGPLTLNSPHLPAIYNGPLDEHLRFQGEGVYASHHYSYEGTFVDGLNSGRGKMLSCDGESYEGEWLRGRRHGWGRVFQPDGRKLEGYWHEDSFQGIGKMVGPEGLAYHGEWQRHTWHGWGVISVRGRLLVVGHFKFGVLHGWARIVGCDGAYWEDRWFQMGVPVGNITRYTVVKRPVDDPIARAAEAAAAQAREEAEAQLGAEGVARANFEREQARLFLPCSPTNRPPDSEALTASTQLPPSEASLNAGKSAGGGALAAAAAQAAATEEPAGQQPSPKYLAMLLKEVFAFWDAKEKALGSGNRGAAAVGPRFAALHPGVIDLKQLKGVQTPRWLRKLLERILRNEHRDIPAIRISDTPVFSSVLQHPRQEEEFEV